MLHKHSYPTPNQTVPSFITYFYPETFRSNLRDFVTKTIKNIGCSWLIILLLQCIVGIALISSLPNIARTYAVNGFVPHMLTQKQNAILLHSVFCYRNVPYIYYNTIQSEGKVMVKLNEDKNKAQGLLRGERMRSHLPAQETNTQLTDSEMVMGRTSISPPLPRCRFYG